MEVSFTRREKIALFVFAAGLAFVLAFGDFISSDYEWIWLLLVVCPVGWLLATDPGRVHKPH